jgi:hypothetical protein
MLQQIVVKWQHHLQCHTLWVWHTPICGVWRCHKTTTSQHIRVVWRINMRDKVKCPKHHPIYKKYTPLYPDTRLRSPFTCKRYQSECSTKIY